MNIDMSNKSFTFTVKSPPTSWLLMQAAGVEKGAGDPPAGKNLILLGSAPNPALPQDTSIPTVGFKEIGSVTLKHIYEIAKIKKQDDHLKHIPLESLARSVLGTSRNIGIRVVRESNTLLCQSLRQVNGKS
jgi:large subunit ribosomal protein L11